MCGRYIETQVATIALRPFVLVENVTLQEEIRLGVQNSFSKVIVAICTARGKEVKVVPVINVVKVAVLEC